MDHREGLMDSSIRLARAKEDYDNGMTIDRVCLKWGLTRTQLIIHIHTTETQLLNVDYSSLEARVAAHLLANPEKNAIWGLLYGMDIKGTVTGRIKPQPQFLPLLKKP